MKSLQQYRFNIIIFYSGKNKVCQMDVRIIEDNCVLLFQGFNPKDMKSNDDPYNKQN